MREKLHTVPLSTFLIRVYAKKSSIDCCIIGFKHQKNKKRIIILIII